MVKTTELREAARNIQGNLGRCLYRRKDVDEMQKVCDLLFKAADTIESIGSSTLTAEQVRMAVKGHGNIMDNRLYEDWQAVADELNAELGGEVANTDDALNLLDKIREADRISYDDYSQLFDAIEKLGSGTCGDSRM